MKAENVISGKQKSTKYNQLFVWFPIASGIFCDLPKSINYKITSGTFRSTYCFVKFDAKIT